MTRTSLAKWQRSCLTHQPCREWVGRGFLRGLGWGTSEERLTYALSSCSLFFLLMILNPRVRPKTQALFLSHRPCPFQGSMSRAGVLYKGNVSPPTPRACLAMSRGILGGQSWREDAIIVSGKKPGSLILQSTDSPSMKN